MANILITGGTGMVGRALTQVLIAKGHQVAILTRNPTSSSNPNISYYQWDIPNGTIDPKAISSADHIIHLAGAGVADKRWNKARKQEILDSRVQSGELLVHALKTIPNQVQSLVSASGIGWYGPDTAKSLDKGFMEDAPADKDFLGETCQLWENAVAPIATMGKRLVIFRFGIVLSNDGGAMIEFKKPVKFGIATILGSGNQIISWIHIKDLCNLLLQAIEETQFNGIYNAVAPETVTNKNLMLTLAKKMKGSFYLSFHVPAFLLKLVLGEMSIEVLKSAKVNSFKIQSAGFKHTYPTIDQALEELVQTSK
ncbi:MAG: TIGR01777 family protein [Bacteroidetes bacterium 24-39-8]|jgi:uncharacterized protein (TIGR01777 family)|nr:MAG: TIGR01777 family protein [Sphingobacteriia bacterium 35-40-8]OYZ52259.1 MAG: TIGR01777 family protein [Bacteroidetes bacterium 24-39-8]HQR92067.1 TIGR01777 family oxidoreductase [Sediminibacterium sp.]HQS54668.1 TIGR01777 family oxidoreductase [Sediminibacterium sp.]